MVRNIVKSQKALGLRDAPPPTTRALTSRETLKADGIPQTALSPLARRGTTPSR